MPIVAYQLIPIVVVLLPLLVAVSLTLYWRHSLSSPWLYALLGTVVAYAVATGIGWVSEKYELSVRGRVGGGYAVFRDDGARANQAQSPTPAPQDSGPMFEPLSTGWFALLVVVVVLCSLALWALKFFFRSAAP
jgi:hypothetical protein